MSYSRPLVLLVTLVLVLGACSQRPVHTPAPDQLAYRVDQGPDRLHRFAPTIIQENGHLPFNRVGEVRATLDSEDHQQVLVDPSKAVLYGEERTFTGLRGNYTNLIYRYHFPEVPFSLIPFHLVAGRNVGLLIILTLDAQDRPLLYTLLHTCGCYLCFLPTDLLQPEAYPETWPSVPHRQAVYGEVLPGQLQIPHPQDPVQLFVLSGHATHRVRHLWLGQHAQLRNYTVIPTTLRPMHTLERLELANGELTSMFEQEGPRKGYVKGSHKVWERVLMGWWALDWRVGEDKKLGQNDQDGTVVYTSLKPWAREQSDLRDFAAFLRYWQWRL